MMRAFSLVAAQALPSGQGGALAEGQASPEERGLYGKLEVKDGDGEEGNSPVSAVLRV